MKRPTIEKVHEVMKGLNMVVFNKAFDVTLFAIRTKDNKSNKFNDWLGASMFTKSGGIISVIVEATTDAGLFYRENPMTPKGTCIIAHSKQYRGAFTYMEKGGHRGQEAFRQTGGLDYFLDNNKDEYLDFVNLIENQIYNTNFHDMGTVGNNVNNWSAGCGGSTNENMDLLYDMAKIQIEHGHGNKFSLAMLHENMF